MAPKRRRDDAGGGGGGGNNNKRRYLPQVPLSSTVQHAQVHITWHSAKPAGTVLHVVRHRPTSFCYQQSGKGPLIPENSKGFLVSCVTGKEQLASREAIDLLGQVCCCIHNVL